MQWHDQPADEEDCALVHPALHPSTRAFLNRNNEISHATKI
jgi:hypothetical protein